MNITNLITLINNNKAKLLKPEQIHAFLKKELNVNEYMNIKDKKNLVNDIVNECIFYEDGIYKFDDINKYICFTMRTIAAYTNLELSNDIEDDYDALCKAKILDVLINTFKKEYDDINILLQMKCDYILSGNTVEAQIGRFLDDMSEKTTKLIDSLSDKLNNFNMSSNDIQKLLNLIDKQK